MRTAQRLHSSLNNKQETTTSKMQGKHITNAVSNNAANKLIYTFLILVLWRMAVVTQSMHAMHTRTSRTMYRCPKSNHIFGVLHENISSREYRCAL